MTMRSGNDSRDFALDVVRRLRGAGHVALWAGGCVRDHLLGKPPKDYDVATSARPEQVRRLFPRNVAVGESFGVILVLSETGRQVEVATFRSDGAYTDGRHPDHVTYSTPEEDAQRRDFTINGMFFDPVKDEVLDFVGGKKDLADGVIRAIGDPRRRFEEDKLRLLRAVRFSSRFDFPLEKQTLVAVVEMAAQIQVVSPERILMELRELLPPPTRRAGWKLLIDAGLLPHVLPEVWSAISESPEEAKIEELLGFWPRSISLPVGIAAVFSFLPK